MKYINLSMLAFAIGVFSGWTVNAWRLNGVIESINSKNNAASQQAIAKVISENQRMQDAKDQAIAKAEETAKRNALAASAASRERDRLRDQLNASTAYFATATHATVVDYATTLTAVFEHCTAEYLDMATKADGHALDAATLYNGWAKIAK
jgi:hypothetical protein